MASPLADAMFVAPVPVYGVEQADGTLAQARTVAEGAAALRARMAAEAALEPAPTWRRTCAGLIDLVVGSALAAALNAIQPVHFLAVLGIALAATFMIRIATATISDGATLGRWLLHTRCVEADPGAMAAAHPLR